jgi:hypothetical protein
LFETSEGNKLDRKELNHADRETQRPKVYWMKEIIKRVPILGDMARWIYGALVTTNKN